MQTVRTIQGEGAEELASRAEAAGTVGPHLSPAHQTLRNMAIVGLAARGESNAEIARRFGLDRSVVSRIVRGEQKVARTKPLLDRVPIGLVEQMIDSYQGTITAFEMMAMQYVDTNPNAAVGALRSALDARERLQALLASIGKLPSNLDSCRCSSG